MKAFHLAEYAKLGRLRTLKSHPANAKIALPEDPSVAATVAPSVTPSERKGADSGSEKANQEPHRERPSLDSETATKRVKTAGVSVSESDGATEAATEGLIEGDGDSGDSGESGLTEEMAEDTDVLFSGGTDALQYCGTDSGVHSDVHMAALTTASDGEPRAEAAHEKAETDLAPTAWDTGNQSFFAGDVVPLNDSY